MARLAALGFAGTIVMPRDECRGSGRRLRLIRPYYDNIGYADLSDFFYVWLRTVPRAICTRALRHDCALRRSENLSPSPYRHEGRRTRPSSTSKTASFDVFRIVSDGRAVAQCPMTLFYAFKQSRRPSRARTRVDRLVNDAGGSAACRLDGHCNVADADRAGEHGRGHGSEHAGVVGCARVSTAAASCGSDRSAGLHAGASHKSLPGRCTSLQKAHIAPVDLRQAAIGPGMAVFSRFAGGRARWGSDAGSDCARL